MKTLYALLFCACGSICLFSQSNIQQPTSINADGAAPAASAILDVQATDKGMLVPRMTTAQRLAIPSPAYGLLVFDTNLGNFYYNNSGPWVPLSVSYTAGLGIDLTGNVIKNIGDLSSTNEIQTLGLSGNMLSLSNGGGTADFSSLGSKWTLSGSDIYHSTGNVGINTATPAAKLEVENGTVLFEGGTGSVPVSGAGTRLMWIPEKKAFRAGLVNGTHWDNANIGFASFAAGKDNIASGENTFVGGASNTASGQSSFVAGGESNTASGLISFTGGGVGLLSKSFGEAVVGTFNTDYTPASANTFNTADRIFVIGNGANSGTRSNAMTVLKSGNIGINTSSPAASALLDVQSTSKGILVPRMTTAQRTAIASPATGLLVYDTSTGGFWFYNGGWQSLSGSSYTAGVGIGVAGNVISNTGDLSTTNEIQTLGLSGNILSLSNGGSTADFSSLASKWTLSGSDIYRSIGNVGINTATPTAKLEVENGAVLFEGTTGATPVSGAGTRLMWIPEKQAFRAGFVGGNQWDDANIGNFSFVGGGSNHTASGAYSFIGGGSNHTASGGYSFIGGGYHNTTSGMLDAFIGGGSENVASGQASFIGAGGSLQAESYAESVFGTYNTDYAPASATTFDATDRLFVIGNGTSSGARSNALTILKNGRTGIGTETPTAYTHSLCTTGIGQVLAWYPSFPTPITIGLLGESLTPNGSNFHNIGVAGHAISTGSFYEGIGGVFVGENIANSIAVGVRANAVGGGSYNYGIIANASGATNNYAGYFTGDVQVTGTLSKAGGSFKIDHPQDPANQYLQHSFVESPDMMNVYNGNVTTDANGDAIVELPDYFETLNRDFRYQLTCIGQFAQVIVAEEVQGNSFKIKTDKPQVKVSWQVTGIRHDPWAEQNRIVPELEKPAHEKGLYLNPEVYGKGEDLQMHSPNRARKSN